MADNEIDEATQAEMDKLDERDNRPRRPKAEKPTKSTFTEAELTNASGKVWVKCVSELGPWAGGIEMKFWKDYEVVIEEALVLEARRHVVILITPKTTKEKKQ